MARIDAEQLTRADGSPIRVLSVDDEPSVLSAPVAMLGSPGRQPSVACGAGITRTVYCALRAPSSISMWAVAVRPSEVISAVGTAGKRNFM